MKSVKIIIMVGAFAMAFYQQVSGNNNIYLIAISVVIFMYGMMQLSSKTPSKNQEKNESDVD